MKFDYPWVWRDKVRSNIISDSKTNFYLFISLFFVIACSSIQKILKIVV